MHVARMGEGRGVHRVLVGKPEGKDHWGDLDIGGRVILRWVFGKWEEVETGRSWFRIRTEGTCEYGDETSGSIKYGEFLDYLQNQLASQEGLCCIE